MQYEILLTVPEDRTMILRYDTIEQAQLACKNVTEADLVSNSGQRVTATPLNFSLRLISS